MNICFLMTGVRIPVSSIINEIYIFTKLLCYFKLPPDRYSKGKQINLVSINSVNSAYFVLASHTTTTFSKFSLEKQIWPPHNFCFRSLSLAFITSTMISSSTICFTHTLYDCLTWNNQNLLYFVVNRVLHFTRWDAWI